MQSIEPEALTWRDLEVYTFGMANVKVLLSISPEMDKALRFACDAQHRETGKACPMGPLVELLLGKSLIIQRAARAARVTLPKRDTDARGKYSRA